MNDIDRLKLLAEHGDVRSQYELGDKYFYKIEDDQEHYLEALIWYKIAAKNGDTKSQYSIGIMYYFGLGVEKDYVESMKWFKLCHEYNKNAIKYIDSILEIVRKSNDKKLLCDILKIHDPDHYKLEIKSMEKQL